VHDSDADGNPDFEYPEDSEDSDWLPSDPSYFDILLFLSLDIPAMETGGVEWHMVQYVQPQVLRSNC
jgi:hypothetical protein